MTNSLARFRCVFLCLTMMVSQAPAAWAADYETLFNGRDLTGWKGLETFWSVVDGAIVGETTKEKPTKGNTFLVWQGGEVADFDFRCQVRFRGNNSGVQYRSKVVDEANYVVAGYQCDLHPSQNYFGMLYGEKMPGRGIIAQRNQAVLIDAEGKAKVTGPVGGKTNLTDWAWNEVRITAVGSRLIHQINGEITVDVTDNAPSNAAKGILALQLHAGGAMRVEFKDLKLRRLTGDEAAGVLKEVLAAPAPGSGK